MPTFYDHKGLAVCEACADNIPDHQKDGPHETHCFQCQECGREFDSDDAGD